MGLEYLSSAYTAPDPTPDIHILFCLIFITSHMGYYLPILLFYNWASWSMELREVKQLMNGEQ